MTSPTSLVDNNSRLHAFLPAIRTLWIRVEDPRLQRKWTAGARPRPSGQSPVIPRVHGRALLEKDSLRVIGWPDRATDEVDFTLRPANAEGDPAGQTWARHEYVQAELLRVVGDGTADDDRRLSQFLHNCYADFEQRAPSVAITFVRADRDIGNKDTWFLECLVPQSVFDAVAGDVAGNRVTTLAVGLTINPTLSDEWYAPPSAPVTLGILGAPDARSGASGFGWVDDIIWTPTADAPQATARTDGVASNEPSPPLEPTSSAQIPERTASVTVDAIAELSRRTTRGFILVLILIALAAVFR